MPDLLEQFEKQLNGEELLRAFDRQLAKQIQEPQPFPLGPNRALQLLERQPSSIAKAPEPEWEPTPDLQPGMVGPTQLPPNVEQLEIGPKAEASVGINAVLQRVPRDKRFEIEKLAVRLSELDETPILRDVELDKAIAGLEPYDRKVFELSLRKWALDNPGPEGMMQRALLDRLNQRVQRGVSGLRDWGQNFVGGILGLSGPGQEEQLRRRQVIDDLRRGIDPAAGANLLEKGILGAGESLPFMGVGVAAQAAGGPIAAGAALAAFLAGDAYKEYRNAGFTTQQSRIAALITGPIEGAVEMWRKPLDVLFPGSSKGLTGKGVRPLFREILKNFRGELSEEVAQDLSRTLTGEVLDRIGGGDKWKAVERLKAVARQFPETAVAVGVMVGAPGAVSLMGEGFSGRGVPGEPGAPSQVPQAEMLGTIIPGTPEEAAQVRAADSGLIPAPLPPEDMALPEDMTPPPGEQGEGFSPLPALPPGNLLIDEEADLLRAAADEFMARTDVDLVGTLEETLRQAVDAGRISERRANEILALARQEEVADDTESQRRLEGDIPQRQELGRPVPEQARGQEAADAGGVLQKLEGQGGEQGDVAGQASDVVVMPVADIAEDPDRFQYKLERAAITGETSLRGAKRFDLELAGVISVWRDPADGKTYVINGHGRLALAKRTGQQSVVVRYLSAKTAEEARTRGALINIAEGRGTSIDAAKFLRDKAFMPDDLAEMGLDLTEKTASEGLALANLHPKLFSQVIRGDMSIKRGTILGAITENAQLAVSQRLNELNSKRKREVSDATLKEMIELSGISPTETVTEQTLFGEDLREVNRFAVTAELSNWVRAQLRSKAKTFGFLGKESRAEQIAQERVGEVNAALAKEIGYDAAVVEDIYGRLSRAIGPVSAALKEGAKKITQGLNKEKVRNETLGTITEELRKIESGGKEGVYLGGDETRAERLSPGEAQAQPEVAKEIVPTAPGEVGLYGQEIKEPPKPIKGKQEGLDFGGKTVEGEFLTDAEAKAEGQMLLPPSKPQSETGKALDELGKYFTEGMGANRFLDPQLYKLIVKLVAAVVKDGATTFKQLVRIVADKYGADRTTVMGEALEKAWNEAMPKSPATPTAQVVKQVVQEQATELGVKETKGAAARKVEEITKRAKQAQTPSSRQTVLSAFPDMISAERAVTDRIADTMGLGGQYTPTRIEWQENIANALAQRLDARADDIAAEVNAEPRALNADETAGLVIRATRYINNYDELSTKLAQTTDKAEVASLSSQRAELEEKLFNLVMALRRSGTEKGRNLAAQKLTLTRSYKLAEVKVRARIANGGKALTDKQVKKLEKIVAELEKKNKEWELKNAELRSILAGDAIKRIPKRTVATKELKQERVSLATEIAELLRLGCAAG